MGVEEAAAEVRVRMVQIYISRGAGLEVGDDCATVVQKSWSERKCEGLDGIRLSLGLALVLRRCILFDGAVHALEHFLHRYTIEG